MLSPNWCWGILPTNGNPRSKICLASWKVHPLTNSCRSVHSSVSPDSQLMWQNTIFTRATCEGELKLLVSVANKTAYHGIKSYYSRCWTVNSLVLVWFFAWRPIQKILAILSFIFAARIICVWYRRKVGGGLYRQITVPQVAGNNRVLTRKPCPRFEIAPVLVHRCSLNFWPVFQINHCLYAQPLLVYRCLSVAVYLPPIGVAFCVTWGVGYQHFINQLGPTIRAKCYHFLAQRVAGTRMLRRNLEGL